MEWADGFIERQRARPRPDELGAFPSVLGCFLGACVIQAAGGQWAHEEARGIRS